MLPQKEISNGQRPKLRKLKYEVPIRARRRREKQDDGDVSSSGERERFFACPFFKFNPRKYQRCGSKLLRTADILRQHIQRAHYHAKVIVCRRCWREFPDSFAGREAMREHFTPNLPCQVVTGPDELFEEEWELLYTRRGISDEEKWYQIWDQLFAAHPRPFSPYLSGNIFHEAVSLLSSQLQSQAVSRVDFDKLAGDIMMDPEAFIPSTLMRRGDPTGWENYKLPPHEAAAREAGPSTDSAYWTLDNSTRLGGKEAARELGRSHEATDLESIDDAATTYSNTTSLRDPALDKYVDAFTDQLSASLSLRISDAKLLKVAPAIEDLLRVFAMQVCCEGDSAIHRTLMHLVHRYRRRIVRDLCDMDKAAGRDDDQESGDDDDQWSSRGNGEIGIPGKEKARTWIESMDLNMELGQEGRRIDSHDDEHWVMDDDDLPLDLEEDANLADYREFLIQHPAYKWLLARIASVEALQVPGQANAHKAAGDAIRAKFTGQKHISRKMRTKTTIDFHIPDWHIAEFHQEQQYSCTLDQVLVQAITLTGWDNDVQATTCLEYVEQVWGESGLKLQNALRGAIIEPGEWHNVTFPCATTVQVRYSNDCFEISASGSPFTIAEIGEQLSWLLASLRSSPWARRGVAYCTPIVSLHDILDERDSSAPTADTNPARAICRIKVQFDGPDPSHAEENVHPTTGSCWRQCLHSPVVVTGYPITRRTEHGSGLEVSVGVMASLANAKYLVEWGGRTVLKGFSTMLAVSKVEESTVFWHLFYNERGNYISYEDVRVPRVQEGDPSLVVDHDALSTRRHILGWSEKVEILAGSASPEVNYDIGFSQLPRPSQSFAWEKISISAGKILNVGASISIAVKDKPEHISYDDDYISTVNMIADRYFIFYDTDDKRACLLDGARAVLHLLRAFIEECLSSRRLAHLCEFKPEEFQNDAPEGADAAFWVLVNEQNQVHPLWKKTASPSHESSMELGEKLKNTIKTTCTYFCVKDKVLQICRVLQQISAHMDDVHNRDGVGAKIRFTSRRQLEGFDFRDIATAQGTIWPQAAELCARGFGWVDFTREIGAIPIFGSGFGELFRPVGDPCQLCMLNVQQGGDLLAVAVSDIKTILTRWGRKRTNPLRLVGEQIQWHSPDKAFESCTCGDESSSSPRSKPRHERVQLLLPVKFSKLWVKDPRSPSLRSLPEDGAVLFGHSRKFPLIWGAKGTPDQGTPDCTCEQDEDGEGSTGKTLSGGHDSGLGSSFVTTPPFRRSRSMEHGEGSYGVSQTGDVLMSGVDGDTFLRGGSGSQRLGIYSHPNSQIG